MRGMWIKIASVGLLAGALTACSTGEPDLLNLTASRSGPDEFAILPTKPLLAPPDYAALPVPTPNAGNRADPTPQADAVAALGGSRSALSGGGISDSALVGHAGRYGIASDIRADLAAADLEYRRRNDGRLLERIFNVSTYFSAYEAQSLDQYRELERLRSTGVRTPAAPPRPTAK